MQRQEAFASRKVNKFYHVQQGENKKNFLLNFTRLLMMNDVTERHFDLKEIILTQQQQES